MEDSVMTDDLKRFALDLISRGFRRRMGVRPMGWTLRPDARVFEAGDVIYHGVIIRRTFMTGGAALG